MMENEEAAARRALSEALARLMFRTPRIRRQSDLAAATGLTQATISRVMAGSQNVTLELLVRIAQAFEVQPGALLMDGESSDVLALYGKLPQEDRAVVLDAMRQAEMQHRPAIRANFTVEFPPSSEQNRQERTLAVDKRWGEDRSRVKASQLRDRLGLLSISQEK